MAEQALSQEQIAEFREAFSLFDKVCILCYCHFLCHFVGRKTSMFMPKCDTVNPRLSATLGTGTFWRIIGVGG